MTQYFKLTMFFASFFTDKEPQEISHTVDECELENFMPLVFLLLKDGIIKSFEVAKNNS